MIRVKSIRGSIKYNGIVYEENTEFEIDEIHLEQVRENIEILSKIKDTKNKTQIDEDVQEENTQDKAQETEDKQNSEEQEENQEIDYSKMKKSDLIKLAEQRGMAIPDKVTNAELIELLKGN